MGNSPRLPQPNFWFGSEGLESRLAWLRNPIPSPGLPCGLMMLALAALALLGACSGQPGSEETSMKAGLEALHKGNDPATAAAQFRKVLERSPSHYGATFQLATALDRAGKPDEARPYWEKMLVMAEAARDDGTAARARTRLGKPQVGSETATPEAMMKAGLDLLYTKRDPAAAAAQFRKVLRDNPTHYGATFQLATALDREGKPAEARPLWEKVLTMAESVNDKQTTETARTRLARQP